MNSVWSDQILGKSLILWISKIALFKFNNICKNSNFSLFFWKESETHKEFLDIEFCWWGTKDMEMLCKKYCNKNPGLLGNRIQKKLGNKKWYDEPFQLPWL